MAVRRRGDGAARRRALAGSALVVALLVPVTASSAQESPPETGEIRNGTAKAVAVVNRIGPGVGDLELAMRGGIAVTQITNSLAQATSHTLDLGLIGTSLTAESCRGDQRIRPEDLPQPTAVDNRTGPAREARDESGTEGSPFGLGRMRVAATQDPVASEAVTTANGIDATPALRLGGGRATARTEVLPGAGRQAEAEVVSDLEIGGVLTLDGMRWHAFHRTGVDPHAEAGFEPGRVSIGGQRVPATDATAVEDAANQALAPFGARVELPRVERFSEPTDLVRVSPLRLEIRDSPAGRLLFGPLLEASRGARSDMFEALSAAVCETASLLLVGDVVLSVVAGTGFLTLELGGAEASSSDFELRDPFGAPVAPPILAATTVPAPAAPAGDPSSAAPEQAASHAAPSAAVPAAPSVPASSRSGPVEELCESVHPNGDSCSEGAALALGLLALLATAGVAGADVFRQRRAGRGGGP